jgi:hypothetical protein
MMATLNAFTFIAFCNLPSHDLDGPDSSFKQYLPEEWFFFQKRFSHLGFIYKILHKREIQTWVFFTIKGIKIFRFSHIEFIEEHVRSKAEF